MNIHVQLAGFYHELDETDRHDTLTEHSAIYEALRTHDPEAAVRAIQNHLDGAEVRICTLMETQSAEPAR